MNGDGDITSLRNELLRRIGRNLVNYQKLEYALKYLVSTGNISGPIKQLAAIREARVEEARKSTMGSLSRWFADDFLSDAGEPEDTASDSDPRARLSISFSPGLDAVQSQKLLEDLATVVADRNELVHQLPLLWEGNSIESTERTLDYLDAQRNRLIPVLDHFQSMASAVREGARLYFELMHSPEGRRELELAWLRQCALVQTLMQLPKELAAPDGWLALGTAGRLLRARLPDETVDFQKQYGYRTLKRLMVATELFDMKDEPTAGGFRTAYRCKESD